MTTPEYKIYALRYAYRDAKRTEHFIGGDPHDAPMRLDYFVWAAVSPEKTWIIDTGFTAEVAQKRKRVYERCPIESLRLLGIEPDTIDDVIISHLHYDHVGSFHKFARAQFHLQEAEMHYACGRYMRYEKLRHSFEVEDVVGIVRANFAGRVVFHDGDAELGHGVKLHCMGGHSAGLQCATVPTARGTVVLAADVAHFYENYEKYRPFVTAFHIGKMLEGFDTLRKLAPSPRHIIPGHDPLVMLRYPAVPGLEGIAVRLDLEPIA